MREWNRYVRDRLLLRLRPERETEIINELAQQLEQASSDFLRAGLSEEEAQARPQRRRASGRRWRVRSTPPKPCHRCRNRRRRD